MNIEEQRRVLIIDDDRSSCSVIVQTLEPRGFWTFTVADPEEGVKKARELEPDLIFVNILFPSSNGLKVSKTIHSDEKLSHVPIIMLTSYRGELDPKYTGTIGVMDVLVKPLKEEEVLSKTVNLIGEGSPLPDEHLSPEEEISVDEDTLDYGTLSGLEIAPESYEEPAAETFQSFAEEGEEFSGELHEESVLSEHAEDLIAEEPPQAGDRDIFDRDAQWAGKEELSHRGESDFQYEDFPDSGDESEEMPVAGPFVQEEGSRPDDDEAVGTKESSSAESLFLSGDERDSLMELDRKSGSSTSKKILMIAALILIIAGLVVAGLQARKFFFSGAKEEGSVTEISEAPLGTPHVAAPAEEEDLLPAGEKSPETPPAPPEKVAKSAEESFRYSVQTGAFGSEKNALSFADGLKRKGYDAFVEKDDSKKIFRVLVGRFDSAGRASEEAGKIKTEEGLKAFVYRK